MCTKHLSVKVLLRNTFLALVSSISGYNSFGNTVQQKRYSFVIQINFEII